MKSDREKMKYFFDNILIPSLQIHLDKYTCFVKVLEESENSDMKFMARKIGMC